MKSLFLIFLGALASIAQPMQIEHRYVSGFLWQTESKPNADVSVTFADTGKYVVAAIHIVNKSNQRFDILPDQVELAVTSGRTPRFLRNLSAEDIARDLNRGLAWSAVASALAAQSATRRQTSVSETSGTIAVSGPGGSATGGYTGTTTSTTRVPDTVAQQQIYENQRQRAAAAQADIAAVQRFGISANTVDPGREYKSAAFFQREKSCGTKNGCRLQLQVTIDRSTFLFPGELHKK